MQQSVALRQQVATAKVPLPVRFLGKLVLEVMPAAMASVIGAFLFANYQFGHAAVSPMPAPAAAAPASVEMVQLVREEHAMIRDFIVAQQAAAKSRDEAADAADAEAAAAAKLASAAAQRAAAMAAAKLPAPRSKPIVVASAAAPSGSSTATAELPAVVVAGAQPNASVPLTAPQPANASLVSRTLAVPRHVVAMTLHAVMAIGGIPSWIGRRVGAGQLDSDAPSASTAS